MPDPRSNSTKIIFNEMEEKLNCVSNDFYSFKKAFIERSDKLEFQIKIITVILSFSFIITALHLFKVI